VTQFETRDLRVARRLAAEEPLRAVIADDCLLLREGLARMLETSGFVVVGRAGDGPGLLRKVRAHRPDIALVELRMPPTHGEEGLEAARVVRAGHPRTGVLLLSHHVEERYAAELFAHGADGVGYLLKDRVADLERFTDALCEVASGGSALDPEVVVHMVGRRRRTGALDDLTAHEREHRRQARSGRSRLRAPARARRPRVPPRVAWPG
jgi:DNA-binding NarL/FixJ family response regulator